MFKNKSLWIVLAVLFVLVFSLILYFYRTSDSEEVASFKDCVEAGYPILETYPRQCKLPYGEIFVEDLESYESSEGLHEGEFYGSSTYYPCQSDEDCVVDGCNGEICSSVEEEGMASICLFPEEPLPTDLGYSCGCFDGECKWNN